MAENQVQFQVTLPPGARGGSFRGFCQRLAHPEHVCHRLSGGQGNASIRPSTPSARCIRRSQVLEARVGARVRIPSEQIFPLIAALQEQGDKWLEESGRSEPPVDWTNAG